MAARDIAGPPGFSIGIIFIAFGVYVREYDYSFLAALAMKVVLASVPAQLVIVEALSANLSLIGCVILVFIINIRLLPMSFSLSGYFRHSTPHPLAYYSASYFVAVTAWMNFINRHLEISPQLRFNYFLYTGFLAWSCGLVGLTLGYYVIYHLSDDVTVALLLLNPLYFLAIVCGHAREDKLLALAIVGGIATFLPFNAISTEFSMALAGLTGGTIAMAVHLYLYRGKNSSQDSSQDSSKYSNADKPKQKHKHE